MVRATVGDRFKAKRKFTFCDVIYRKWETFKVVRVHKASAMRGSLEITITDMYGRKEITISAEKFGEYMRDGYFMKITDDKEKENKMSGFELQVGDIVKTKVNFFTVVSDSNGVLCAFDHRNFQFLYINTGDMYINDENYEHEILKVYRHSKIDCEDYGFHWDSLCKDTQVYPPIKKVKLTLSQIKTVFGFENDEVEIDFEN